MSTKRCPYCGEEIPESAQKCEFCGEQLAVVKAANTQKKMITCPVCAEEIEADAKVCPYCHEVLMDNKESQEVQPEPQQTGKKEDKKEQSQPVQVDGSSLAKSAVATEEKSKSVEKALGFIDHYFVNNFITHYADFNGKASRKEFWFGYLYYALLIFLASCFDIAIGSPFILTLLISLGLIVPSLALIVRRLHDIGKSGWWIFVYFVPLIGPIWWLILMCKKGNKETPLVKHVQKDFVVYGVGILLFIISLVLIGLSGSSTETSSTEEVSIGNVNDGAAYVEDSESNQTGYTEEEYEQYMEEYYAAEEDKEGELQVSLEMVLEYWDTAHNDKDYDTFASLYADQVLFYGQNLSLEQCIANKKKLLDSTYKEFIQHSDNMRYEMVESGVYMIYFDKRVTFDGKSKTFPSYLRVRHDEYNAWKIIEESDAITDYNLQK